jgi:exonuclease VII small subunit
VDDVLDQLEAVIARLADPSAPLQRLVGDFEEAGRLAARAQAELTSAATALGIRSESRDGP